jgi:hypothetical protein
LHKEGNDAAGCQSGVNPTSVAFELEAHMVARQSTWFFMNDELVEKTLKTQGHTGCVLKDTKLADLIVPEEGPENYIPEDLPLFILKNVGGTR